MCLCFAKSRSTLGTGTVVAVFEVWRWHDEEAEAEEDRGREALAGVVRQPMGRLSCVLLSCVYTLRVLLRLPVLFLWDTVRDGGGMRQTKVAKTRSSRAYHVADDVLDAAHGPWGRGVQQGEQAFKCAHADWPDLVRAGVVRFRGGTVSLARRGRRLWQELSLARYKRFLALRGYAE